MGRRAHPSGQASVELVAVVPALLLAALIAGQLVLVGYSLWSAGAAARAGARAAHVGGDPQTASRSALPTFLRERARVGAGDGGSVEVRVEAPSLLPGVPRVGLEATATLDPSGASGG
jgi:hypothetical protein